VLLLTIASEKNGDIPKDFDDLAFELRMEPKRVRLAVKVLVDVGLLVDCETCFRTPDWNERQFKSDSSKERVRAFRERHRNVTVTAQETETETDTDTEKKKETTVLRTVSKKARSQIGDWIPSLKEQEAAANYWQSKGRPDISLSEQVDQFRDHHLKLGSLMADWPAAWRTWYRNAPKMTRQEHEPRKSARSRQLDGAARWFQKEEYRNPADETLAALPAPRVVQRDPRRHGD
jgi:hypothetical protein